LWRASRLERRRLHEGIVLEWTGGRLGLRIHAVPNGTALHEDDWVMTVFARDGRGQSKNEPRLCLPGHLFETVRGEVVALVDDEMAVPIHAVVDHAFLDETLNDGHVDDARGRVSSTADAAD